MSDVTRILSQIESGDVSASEQLLPLVYEELRRLAEQWLAHEPTGQTLQSTALVHEAYLRLVNVEHQQRWDSRGHFFAAAAEAMRRILVENARRKGSLKQGGKLARRELHESRIAAPREDEDEELLALDEALDRLTETDSQAAQLVKLRYFSGLTIPQAAELLDVSPRTANRLWSYAKAWLHDALRGEDLGRS